MRIKWQIRFVQEWYIWNAFLLSTEAIPFMWNEIQIFVQLRTSIFPPLYNFRFRSMDSRHLFYTWSIDAFIQAMNKFKCVSMSSILYLCYFFPFCYVVMMYNIAIVNLSDTLMGTGTNKPRLLYPPLLCMNLCMLLTILYIDIVINWFDSVCFDDLIWNHRSLKPENINRQIHWPAAVYFARYTYTSN